MSSEMFKFTTEALTGASGLIGIADRGIAGAINASISTLGNVETELKIAAYAVGAKLIANTIGGVGLDVPFMEEATEISIAQLTNQLADCAIIAAAASAGNKVIKSYEEEVKKTSNTKIKK